MISRQLLSCMLSDLESLRLECEGGLGGKGFVAPWCMREKLERIQQTLCIIEAQTAPGDGTVALEVKRG